MADPIQLTDDQRALLDERLKELLVARQRADTALERFNELVRLLGGDGAQYNQEQGVIDPPEKVSS